MTAEDFYRVMIEKLDCKPFQPFVIDLNDGRRVEIERPKTVSIRGGVAACSTRDCIYVRVDCGDVREIIDLPVSKNGRKDMTADEIKNFQKTQPFKPFRIVLSDGKNYDVPHPNFVWVRTSTVYVATRGDSVRGLWDDYDQIELSRVKEVQVMSATALRDEVAGS